MPDRSVILIVERSKGNRDVLSRLLGNEGYDVRQAADYADFEKELDDRHGFHLALIDLIGYDSRIWGYCERLRGLGLPFLVISSRETEVLQEEILSSGARGMLLKPLIARDLLSLIKGLVERQE